MKEIDLASLVQPLIHSPAVVLITLVALAALVVAYKALAVVADVSKSKIGS